MLAALVGPAAAQARSADRNHDGIADKWEKKNHLSTHGRAVAKQDPDKDGLTNAGEFRSHTNPHLADTNHNGVGDASEDPDHDGVDNDNELREHTDPLKADTNHNGRKDGLEDPDHDRLNNHGEDQAGDDPIDPDSNNDGVKDGDENAGTIVGWDGTTLAVKLFAGGTLTGVVDDATDISCDSPEGDGSGDGSGDFGSGDSGAGDSGSGSGDPGSGSGPGGDETPSDARRARIGLDGILGGRGADSGDDSNAGDATGSLDDNPGSGASGDGGDSTGADSSGADCTTADLAVGVVVHEASITASASGAVFDSLDLAK